MPQFTKDTRVEYGYEGERLPARIIVDDLEGPRPFVVIYADEDGEKQAVLCAADGTRDGDYSDPRLVEVPEQIALYANLYNNGVLPSLSHEYPCRPKSYDGYIGVLTITYPAGDPSRARTHFDPYPSKPADQGLGL